MIIRLTVNDNDFYYLIMDFMKQMWDFPINKKPVKEMSCEETQDEIERLLAHEKIKQLLNPNCDKFLNEQEQKTVITYLKDKFATYINSCEKDEQIKKYLVESLEIKIQKSFVDRWENGEAFYWLQHSHKIINQ